MVWNPSKRIGHSGGDGVVRPTRQHPRRTRAGDSRAIRVAKDPTSRKELEVGALPIHVATHVSRRTPLFGGSNGRGEPSNIHMSLGPIRGDNRKIPPSSPTKPMINRRDGLAVAQGRVPRPQQRRTTARVLASLVWRRGHGPMSAPPTAAADVVRPSEISAVPCLLQA